MTYAEQLHAERKARLERLKATAPHRDAVKGLNALIEEHQGLIEEITEANDIPDVVAEWVKRQRDLTRDLLAAVQKTEEARPTIAAVLTKVADYFGVDRSEMLSARRLAQVVYPRHVAYYLCRTLTLRSMPEIGRKIGGRDHTTIMHGIRKIERAIKLDWEVAFDVAQIEKSLKDD